MFEGILNQERVQSILEYFGAKDISINDNMIRSTCPIHGGDNPSAFVWNLNTNLWYCHTQCHIGGDILSLYANINDLDIRNNFNTILQSVCNLLGVKVEDMTIEEYERNKRKELSAWYKYVGTTEKNNEYDLNLLGEFRNIAKYRGLEREFLIENNVRYCTNMDRIVFAIYDVDGKVVGASCRALKDNDKIKWLHRPKGIDTGLELYNLNNIINKDFTFVYVVEGMMDVLNLKKLGIENVVCTFGANITSEQIKLLMKYFIGITFMYDNDIAGKLANIKGVDKTKHCFDLKVADLSSVGVKDAGEILSIEQFNSINILDAKEYVLKEKGER